MGPGGEGRRVDGLLTGDSASDLGVVPGLTPCLLRLPRRDVLHHVTLGAICWPQDNSRPGQWPWWEENLPGTAGPHAGREAGAAPPWRVNTQAPGVPVGIGVSEEARVNTPGTASCHRMSHSCDPGKEGHPAPRTLSVYCGPVLRCLLGRGQSGRCWGLACCVHRSVRSLTQGLLKVSAWTPRVCVLFSLWAV